MVAEPKTLIEEEEIRQMQALFEVQRKAFADDPMPEANRRREHLKRLSDVLVANKERLAEAISDDFGNRSRHETYAELLGSIQGIHYARRHVRRWMRPSRRRAGLLLATTSCKVVYQPKGVVGVIVPFNYPLVLSIGPLACALAAGNRVILKMSEETPRIGQVLKQVLASVFDDEHVAVVLGEVEVGKAFSRLPFDHILFTGSTEVGRHIMRAAADNLTPVTLELGGKSPTLIGDDVPMSMAAERICFGKALNSGQSCVAPDYVLCPAGRVDEFVEAMSVTFRNMYPQLHENADYTCVINDRHFKRLEDHLDDARARGADVIELSSDGGGASAETRKMPLYLIKGATSEMTVMQEEIFGPLLPIISYGSLDEALRFINERPRPLALNLFETDAARRNNIIDATHSGGVCVNDAITHFLAEDLPFGGVGDSGMGHYHAREGFLTFSHHKAVLSRPRINTARVLYAPHGGWLQNLLYRLFLR
ncbi:MAG: coniferyl aldehyde dehydrogenase [Chromatiales bacterium]|jgi:coniferyl-aldehyde dehydrogenase|nr:coniferyl aldehyde dehydrogenase [Chromatiales bacterium]